MSRALRGGVPRGFRDHRTRNGREYTALLRNKLNELGTLPKSNYPMLREWGRTAIQLDELAAELERPSVKKQATVCRRYRREQKTLRLIMLKLEQRLAGSATENHDPHALEERLRGMP